MPITAKDMAPEPRYQILPILMKDGICNLSDEFLNNIWNQIVAEGKAKDLFYAGTVYDGPTWINHIKGTGNFPVVCMDAVERKPVYLAWLNSVGDNHAFAHHCALGPFKRGAARFILDFWGAFTNPRIGGRLFKVLLGLTPETNTKAIKALHIVGFKSIGTIPHICHLAYEGRHVGGVVSYYEYREVD